MYVKSDFGNGDLWRVYDGVTNSPVSNPSIVNQITQLDQLRNGSGVPSVMKNANDKTVFASADYSRSVYDEFKDMRDNNIAQSASSAAYVNVLQVKAIGGYLVGINGFNSGPDQFIQVYNAPAADIDGGSIPLIVFFANENSNFFWTMPKDYQFSAGITIRNSSVGPTPAIGLADCWFNAQFK